MVLENPEKTSRRKLEHVDVVLSKPVEGPLTTWFEYLFLPQRALPRVDPDLVDLEISFLGRRIGGPLMISAMTGGAPGTERINRALAEVSCTLKLALGLGSQRAGLEDPSVVYTYRVARDSCTEIPIIGNIGIGELVRYGPSILERVASMVEADAVAVHLNYFQEVVQPEGASHFSAGMEVLARAVEVSPVPVIVKEVGFGLSREFVQELYNIGIRYVDVAGAGGTNWVLVELYRAEEVGDTSKKLLAEGLKEVGIPTAVSIIEARSVSEELFIVGSGGIRTPYDAVKALRLGANMVGVAKPILEAYHRGTLADYLRSFITGMKAVVASLGISKLSEIGRCPVVVLGLLRDWVEARGLEGVLRLRPESSRSSQDRSATAKP